VLILCTKAFLTLF